jgi:hypothetical protein
MMVARGENGVVKVSTEETNQKPMGPGKAISYVVLLAGMPVLAAISGYELAHQPTQIESLRYWSALIVSGCLFLATFVPKRFAKAVMILLLVVGAAGIATMFTPYGESLFGVGLVIFFSANMVARIHDVE